MVAQAAEPPDEEVTPNDSEETALAVVESEEDNAMAARKALAARVPADKRDDVLFLERPTPSDLVNIVEKLPKDAQSKLMTLVRKTRPKKQGAHSTAEGFSPTQIRVFQGTGNDPARPSKMPPGNFYSTDSRDLGDTIEGVVVGFYYGRTLWPERDSDQKVPICSSMDRKMGNKYKECAKCPFQDKPYTDGGCMREVTFFVIDRDITAVYEIKFNKTSTQFGETIAKTLMKQENLWDRWIVFKNEERTRETYRWYVTKAMPYSDPKNAMATNTEEHLRPLFEAFSKILDADVYYPALANCYDRAKNSEETATEMTTGVDEAKLLGTSATGGMTDFSGDNPNV